MIRPGELDPRAYTIVYSPALPGPASVAEAASVLDAAEQAKAVRFRSKSDARRFLWRRALRRRVLAAVLGAEAEDLAFESVCPRCGSTDHGKPRLVGGSSLHFSASQSGDKTVVAIGPDPVGVDVQTVTEDVRDLGPHIFSSREQAALAVSGDLADERRALLWARKEACLKAVGHGLGIEPAAIHVLGPGFQDGAFHRVQPLGQIVGSWRMGDGPAVALASAAPRPVDVRTLQQGSIAGNRRLHPASS